MSSLYTKYRPQKFADLVGQPPVVATLTAAVARERVAQAYLFSGPKGSGKTTTARLLAKVVNCRERKKGDSEPCNRCDICVAITQGNDLDILEIDAASHRGIEEIRELKEAVKFAPTKANRKVYIIDEVHMLTREAFNALLKTLEEPPAHTLFVLATTEPHKVPATIKSRTQHFLFRRASIPDLVSYLERIAKAEKILIEGDALKLLAGTAEGSFRDATAAMEQVWSAHPKGKITAAGVQELLGLSDRDLLFDFLGALAKGEPGRGMKIVGEITSRGLDVAAFVRETLDLLRALLLLLAGGEREVKASFTDADVQRLTALRKHWGSADVVRLMEALILAAQRSKIAPIPELPLEMLVAEVAGSDSEQGTVNREQSVDRRASKPDRPPTAAVPVAKAIVKVDADVWKSILSEVRLLNTSLYSLLKEAIVLGQTADGIALGVRFRFHAELLSQSKNQAILAEAVTKVLGRPAQILVEVKPDVFTKQEEELLKMAEELL